MVHVICMQVAMHEYVDTLPDNKTVVFVVGAFAHGKIDAPWVRHSMVHTHTQHTHTHTHMQQQQGSRTICSGANMTRMALAHLQTQAEHGMCVCVCECDSHTGRRGDQYQRVLALSSVLSQSHHNSL